MLIKPYKNIDEYYEKVIVKNVETGTKFKQEEDRVLYLLLKYDMIHEASLEDGRILLKILNKNKIISYDAFELLMIRSAEKSMKELNDGRIKNYHPKAYVEKLEEEYGNAFSFYNVTFNKECIEDLYNGLVYTLSTYFHELCHIKQAIEFHLGLFRNNIVDMIKDTVIFYYELKKYGTKKYYKINYYNISFEVEAHNQGIDSAIEFLNKHGLNCYDSLFDVLRNSWPTSNNKERTIEEDGVMVTKTLDEVFDKIIVDCPEFLEKYPQLTIQYVNDEDGVRKRTKEELVDMLISGVYSVETNDYIKGLLKRMVAQEKRKQ